MAIVEITLKIIMCMIETSGFLSNFMKTSTPPQLIDSFGESLFPKEPHLDPVDMTEQHHTFTPSSSSPSPVCKHEVTLGLSHLDRDFYIWKERSKKKKDLVIK